MYNCVMFVRPPACIYPLLNRLQPKTFREPWLLEAPTLHFRHAAWDAITRQSLVDYLCISLSNGVQANTKCAAHCRVSSPQVCASTYRAMFPMQTAKYTPYTKTIARATDTILKYGTLKHRLR